MQKPGDWSFGRNVVNGHYDFPWRVAPPIHALSLLLLSAACTSGALTYTHIYLLSHCSYLVLTAITFTGQLIFGSDLMRSTAYDAHIYQETEHLHPQLPLATSRRAPASSRRHKKTAVGRSLRARSCGTSGFSS